MRLFDEYWNNIVPAMWEVKEWNNEKIKAIVKCAFDAGRGTLSEKYFELLYAVAQKFPDETRHQTALRYIQNAEIHNRADGPAQVEAGHE